MIKIILESSILDKFPNSNHLRWWLDILFMANSDGEVQTNLVQLMQRWQTSQKSVRYFLSNLIEGNLLKKQNIGKSFKLQIIEYNTYLSEGHDRGTIGARQNTDNQLVSLSEGHDRGTIGAREQFLGARQNTDNQLVSLSEGHDEENELKKVSLLSPTPPIITLKNIYNNTTTHTHAHTHTREEEFIHRYKKEGMWPDVAIILHQSVDVCKKLFAEFIREYQHNGQKHESYEDFKKHYIQWARIAISKGQVEMIIQTQKQPKVITNEDILREIRSL